MGGSTPIGLSNEDAQGPAVMATLLALYCPLLVIRDSKPVY